MVEVIKLAGGPRKFAMAVQEAGFPLYSDRTVQSWRQAVHEPPVDLMIWAAAKFRTPLGGLSEPAAATTREILHDHEDRLVRVETKLDEILMSGKLERPDPVNGTREERAG